MTLEIANRELLSKLEPFVVAVNSTMAHLDLEPFGLRIDQRVNPLLMRTGRFLDLLEGLDRLTFGPEGMPMPRWVYLNGAELTGAIFGFGVPAAVAPDKARELLEVADDYDGLVPYSVYIAIPTHERGVWFGHNLAALTSLLPDENLRGLGGVTKAVALKAFRAREQVGATQWDSRALYVHSRLGTLALESAWTPAHGEIGTLTYRVAVTEKGLRHLAREVGATIERPQATRWLSSSDHDGMMELQTLIEGGHRIAIAGPPEAADGGQRIPLVVSA